MMSPLSLQTLRDILGLSEEPQAEPLAEVLVSGVALDSREVVPGDLFVAIAGNRVDGHAFVEQARARGAVAALVTRPLHTALPQLRVDDVHAALGRIGACNRERFPGPVLAVTGSAGKTTCKEMLAAILGQCGPVLATRGNRNNELGLPLTLLELSAQHRYAVLEMGAAREGDIAWLCRHARPDLALVTNALPAHLEGFGNLEGVARGKGELYRAVAQGGIAVIQVDGPFSALWRGYAGAARVLGYALDRSDADVHTRGLRRDADGQRFELVTPAGSVPIQLALLGAHNVLNACAAACAAIAVGADLDAVADGLNAMRPVPRRLQSRRDRCGRLLIDDSYNANPGAVAAAIEVLAGFSGRRALILGDMAELGGGADAFHRAVGQQAARAGIEALWSVGAHAQDTAGGYGSGARAFPDRAALLAAADELDADVLLIKGSRSAAMDQVADALCGGSAAGGQG